MRLFGNCYNKILDMGPKKKVILFFLVLIVFFSFMFKFYGYNKTWRLWNVPVASCYFADSKVITHGVETFALGFDPMPKNCVFLDQIPYNYPRTWLCLSYFGLNTEHTFFFGLVSIILFFCGIFIILSRANNKTVGAIFFAILSPAVLLGIERGNIDLIIFFIVILSVSLIQKFYKISAILILLGVALKLFPIFAVTIFLKLKRGKSVLFLISILSLSLLYFFISYSDLLLIRAITPRSSICSYGKDVLWLFLQNYGANFSFIVRIISHVFVIFVFIFSFFTLITDRISSISISKGLYFDLFRAGSCIYIGTFLLGNNWDYRLMFLIFVIPQLLEWFNHKEKRVRKISKITIFSVYISLWHFLIKVVIKRLPYGDFLRNSLDEMFNYIVFFGLTYLFFLSLPRWIYLRRKSIYKKCPSNL